MHDWPVSAFQASSGMYLIKQIYRVRQETNERILSGNLCKQCCNLSNTTVRSVSMLVWWFMKKTR